MNKLLFISGIVVLAATFLITNTPNRTMAYTCSSSSSTHNVNVQTGVSGSSGSCASSSTATNFPKPGGNAIFCESKGPNNACIQVAVVNLGQGLQAAQSVSAGGAQSSCSSSSMTTSTSTVITTSKSGTCP